MKIGFFGGSFDPVHFGHLMAARDACEQGCLDRVIFIPAARAPLKTAATRTPGLARLALLRAAIADEPRFAVSDHELRRGGVNYTVDTVKHMRMEFPRAKLSWIIGGDQLAQLPQWRELTTLAAWVEFIVIERPGHAVRAPAGLPRGLRLRHCPGHTLGFSSTELRARAKRGLPLDWFTPHKVVALIRRRSLYR